MPPTVGNCGDEEEARGGGGGDAQLVVEVAARESWAARILCGAVDTGIGHRAPVLPALAVRPGAWRTDGTRGCNRVPGISEM